MNVNSSKRHENNNHKDAPDFTKHVVDWKIDLRLVFKGRLFIGSEHRRSISSDGTLNLSLACGHHPGIEIDLHSRQ
jgi:hypothetical protein